MTATKLNDLRIDAQSDVTLLRSKIYNLTEEQLDFILTGARSHYAWQDTPVTDAQSHRIFDITKMGPTSMNCCPARSCFSRGTYPFLRSW